MKTTWRDIVDDFLEVGCQVSKQEREFIIRIFENQKIRSSHITVHPAFSFNGHLVVILKNDSIEKHWVYKKFEKRIQQTSLFENVTSL